MKLKAFGSGTVLAAALAVALAGPVTAAPGAKGHTHVTFNAGTPGDPKKPFRVIEMTAKETKDGMAYDPAKIVVEQNEQVKFVIKNAGELDHEFMLETFEANAKHAIEMQKNPEMEHDDPNGKRVVSKKQSELIWKFSKLGTYEYACLIPGHYEAGMKGVVEVVPRPKSVPAVAAKANGKTTIKQ
jgi:uncharacterized cupredoxin-like copper-binding protein